MGERKRTRKQEEVRLKLFMILMTCLKIQHIDFHCSEELQHSHLNDLFLLKIFGHNIDIGILE